MSSAAYLSQSIYKLPSIKNASSLKIGIIVSEWHAGITNSLLNGCISALLKNKIKKENISTYFVPGSYELILAAQWAIQQKGTSAVICLGCVIQGETKHFDFICQSVATGISDLNLKYNKPVVFGVLTTNNLKQAKERSGGKYGNKGEESAIAALKMIDLKSKLKI